MHGLLTIYLKSYMKAHNNPINADPARVLAGLVIGALYFMNRLTPKIEKKIEVMFPGKVKEVREALINLCDDIICSEPGVLSERICAAILKSSQGNMDFLYESIDLANIDWRDILIGAGFGDDVNAHKDWLK